MPNIESTMKSLRLIAGALVSAALLAACATPGQIQPGATEAQARAALGNPTATYKLPNGGTRLQYSGQPSVQWVWNLDFDAAGKLVSREQVLTDAAFARIVVGRDTRNDIVREFGPPADIQTYPLKQETSYMYRYYTFGGFPSAMYIAFNPAGVVTGTQTGLDPWTVGGPDRK